jgi:hypothetical protein
MSGRYDRWAAISGDGLEELFDTSVDFRCSPQSVVDAVAERFKTLSSSYSFPSSSSSLSSSSLASSRPRSSSLPFSCVIHPSRYRTYSIPACRMASLCISTPSHAGIMSLSTPNSSFILDRLRLSIMLCAVFRAIFLPAALVAEGCLRFAPAVLFAVAGEYSDEVDEAAELDFGFIWIIFRARLGGGGRLWL